MGRVLRYGIYKTNIFWWKKISGSPGSGYCVNGDATKIQDQI